MQTINDIKEVLPKTEDRRTVQFLTFLIGKEVFGIEIRFVTEIISVQNITPLPNLPDYVKGVINYHGQVLPVIDVRLRLNMAERKYDDRTSIIVTSVENVVVGLIVDLVSEIVDIAEKIIEDPLSVNNVIGNRFVKGVAKSEGNERILLDVQKMLDEDEQE